MADEDWYAKTNAHFGDILDDMASQYPEREAIIFGDRRITYTQLQNAANHFARGLLELGVRKGDNVALWMTNCPEWVFAQFAVYKIGAVLVPVNTRFVKDEIDYVLGQSEVTTLILKDRVVLPGQGQKLDSYQVLAELVPELASAERHTLRSDRFPHLKCVVCLSAESEPGTYDFHEVMEMGETRGDDGVLEQAQASVSPFDVMNLIYTSGTTGFPKGGLSPHRTNLASMYHMAERLRYGASDRILLNLPLFTNFGCTYVCAIAIMRGMSLILLETFNPEETLRTVQAERATILPGAPATMIMMLNHPAFAEYDYSSLRVVGVGGAPSTPELVRQIKDKFGAETVFNAYGLSECSGITTTTLADDPIERIAETVGKILPSAAVRIVDPVLLQDLPFDVQGEVWLHDVQPGSQVGQGYYKMPEQTKAAITEDGWFRTGDLGSLDEEGYLKLTGRVKDMFIYGGFNVYPEEIENVLATHPAVKMSAVVGVPDERMGEVGMAYIELKDGGTASEAEIVAFCRERMANYKVPRYVKFVTAAEFPLTRTFKVQKFKLRERAVQELGLTDSGAVST